MAIDTARDFVRQLKDEIRTSGLMLREHPLVRGVSEGTLPPRQLRGWATQDSHYRRNCLSAHRSRSKAWQRRCLIASGQWFR